MEKRFLKLGDLNVYKLARELSKIAWAIYENLDWRERKVIGDQFLTAIDSVGANIAEGYGRYHYLDKIKFFYNARGSLAEGVHWFNVLTERKMTKNTTTENFQTLADDISVKLHNFITATYNQKKNTMS